MCRKGTTMPSSEIFGDEAANNPPDACGPHLLGAGGRPYEISVMGSMTQPYSANSGYSHL